MISASFEKELAEMNKEEVEAIKQRQAERKRERKRKQRRARDNRDDEKRKERDRNERAESLKTEREVKDELASPQRRFSASSGPRTPRSSAGETEVIVEEKKSKRHKEEPRKKQVNRSMSTGSAASDDGAFMAADFQYPRVDQDPVALLPFCNFVFLAFVRVVYYIPDIPFSVDPQCFLISWLVR